MVIGANVRIWTGRPGFNLATRQTGPARFYLADIFARARVVPAQAFQNLPPDLAFKAIYEFAVDVTADVTEGDRLEKVRLFDGVTVWPRHLATSTNYSWVVRYLDPGEPLLLPERVCYVELVRAGK